MLLKTFLSDRKAEIDEKSVLMVVLVLGALTGVGIVTGAINDLFNKAAAGL